VLAPPAPPCSAAVYVDRQTANVIYNCGARNSCAKTVAISLPPLVRTDRPWLYIDRLDADSFSPGWVKGKPRAVFLYHLTLKNTGQSAASPVVVRAVLIPKGRLSHSQLSALSRSGPRDDPTEMAPAVAPGQTNPRLYIASVDDPTFPSVAPQPLNPLFVICIYYFQADRRTERGASCYSYYLTGPSHSQLFSKKSYDTEHITFSFPDEALR
jgi:hypothetical protein